MLISIPALYSASWHDSKDGMQKGPKGRPHQGVTISTSDSTIKKTAMKWAQQRPEIVDGLPDAYETAKKIRHAVGGFLLYQSHLSDLEGLRRYLDAVRPYLTRLMRNAYSARSYARTEGDALVFLAPRTPVPLREE